MRISYRVIARGTACVSVCLLITTIVFAALYGLGSNACRNSALYVVNTPTCLQLEADGVVATDLPCATECDAQNHREHVAAGRYTSASRRHSGKMWLTSKFHKYLEIKDCGHPLCSFKWENCLEGSKYVNKDNKFTCCDTLEPEKEKNISCS